VLDEKLKPEFLAALAEVLIFKLSRKPLADLDAVPVNSKIGSITIDRSDPIASFTIAPQCREWLLKTLKLQSVDKLDEPSLWKALQLEATSSQQASQAVKDKWKNVDLSDLNVRFAVCRTLLLH
jgi:hypothetical protein